MREHNWALIKSKLEIEKRQDFGLIEGFVQDFTGSSFPLYEVGVVCESYSKIEENFLDNTITLMYLKITSDFLGEKQYIFCCVPK